MGCQWHWYDAAAAAAAGVGLPIADAHESCSGFSMICAFGFCWARVWSVCRLRGAPSFSLSPPYGKFNLKHSTDVGKIINTNQMDFHNCIWLAFRFLLTSAISTPRPSRMGGRKQVGVAQSRQKVVTVADDDAVVVDKPRLWLGPQLGPGPGLYVSCGSEMRQLFECPNGRAPEVCPGPRCWKVLENFFSCDFLCQNYIRFIDLRWAWVRI